MWHAPISTGAHAMASAASTRPVRPAPNSAASRAAITMITPPASAGRILMAVGIGAEEVRRAGEQHGERRLVHVAESQVVARHQEVQLVLLEAVQAADRQLHRGEHRGDQPYEPGHPVVVAAPGRGRVVR